MRVLLISFFFPPLNAIGGLRAGKMAKYLPSLGWDPNVLTVFPPDAADLTAPVDIDENRIVRTPFKPLGPGRGPEAVPAPPDRSRVGPRMRSFVKRMVRWPGWRVTEMPDAAFGWYPFAASAVRRMMTEQKFDAIFSSGGPPTSHLVARRAQALSGLPWIADFRDPWSDNHCATRAAAWRALNVCIEKWTLRPACHLTAASPAWKAVLESRHGKPVSVVQNGYDPDDYPGDTDDSPPTRFRILYTGRIYEPWQDPSLLFRAAGSLRGKGVLSPADFGIEFHGEYLDRIPRLAAECGAGELVSIGRPLPYRECLAAQRTAAALLYLEWRDIHRGVYAGKVFEYLGAGRPILAVGPRAGPAETLLTECGAGRVASSQEEVERQLRVWMAQFRALGRLPFRPATRAVERYTRAAQAAQLAELLTRATAEPRATLEPAACPSGRQVPGR